VCRETAEWLQARTARCPRTAIICGSGLGGLADALEDKTAFAYEDIPHFPRSTVPSGGHHVHQRPHQPVWGGRSQAGEQLQPSLPLCLGSLQVTFPIRVFFLLGVENLIVTNAAGGLNPQFQVGDIMFIRDHISLFGVAGHNPLRGPNDERFGARFPCMSDAYDQELLGLARESAQELGFQSFTREGVYCLLPGPCYETIAECRLLQALGADAVG
ncbi:Purine nucleoside phosphorylase, partial [Dryobates pubescens]